MKPSELKSGRRGMREADKPVPANISRVADPPITAKETETATHAVCPGCGGLIKRFHGPDDHGKVFYCPEGEQYWRFQDPAKAWPEGKKMRPIEYSNDGIV